jgi:hypothetical protein
MRKRTREPRFIVAAEHNAVNPTEKYAIFPLRQDKLRRLVAPA